MRSFKPPAVVPFDAPSVFLAGSIEMGLAEDWQRRVENELADLDIIVLNPRRDDWDSSWVQSVDNAPFHEQVSWELAGIERADVVIVYLDPATRAPISLLELGLIAVSGRALVCCPDGYYRKGNVDVVCQRYRVPQARNLEELIALARERLTAG